MSRRATSSMLSPAASVAGVAVVVASFALTAWRAAHAPAPPGAVSRRTTPAERANLAIDVAAHERAWRDEAAESFPADAWSQSDDFHAQEARQIRELAHQRHVTFEEVLRAVDEDLHAPKAKGRRPDDRERSVTAVPCKPRPFYD
jgi:hypothetical protein